MDGRTRAGRVPLCCVRRVPGAPAMQCKQTYFLSQTRSLPIFFFLSFSLICQNLFLSFFLDVDGRARAWRAPTVRRARGACLCVVRGTPGARPAYNETRAYLKGQRHFLPAFLSV